MKNKDTTLKEYLKKAKTKYVFYAVAFTVGIVAYIFIKPETTYGPTSIYDGKAMSCLMCALLVLGIVSALYKNRIKKEAMSRLWFARANPEHPEAYEIVKYVLDKHRDDYSDFRLGKKENDRNAIKLADAMKEVFTDEDDYSLYVPCYKPEKIDDYIIEKFPDTPFAEAFGEKRCLSPMRDMSSYGEESNLYKYLAKKYPNSALAKGVARNPDYKFTKNDIEFMVKEPNTILTKGLVYHDTNSYSHYLFAPSMLWSRPSTAKRIYSKEIDIAVSEDLRKLILRYPDSPFSMWFFSSDEYKIGVEEHKLLWDDENKWHLSCIKSKLTQRIYSNLMDNFKKGNNNHLAFLTKIQDIKIDFEYAWHITRNYSYQITKEDIEQIRYYPSSYFAHGVCDNEGSAIYAKQIDEPIGIDYKLVAWLNPWSKFAQALVENELYTIEEIDTLVAEKNQLSDFAKAITKRKRTSL